MAWKTLVPEPGGLIYTQKREKRDSSRANPLPLPFLLSPSQFSLLLLAPKTLTAVITKLLRNPGRYWPWKRTPDFLCFPAFQSHIMGDSRARSLFLPLFHDSVNKSPPSSFLPPPFFPSKPPGKKPFPSLSPFPLGRWLPLYSSECLAAPKRAKRNCLFHFFARFVPPIWFQKSALKIVSNSQMRRQTHALILQDEHLGTL